MAKAKVLDNKVVIESEVFTDENLRKVSILKPSVLSLIDEETKENLYQVMAGTTTGFTKYGAVFNNGKAICTIETNETDAAERTDMFRLIISEALIKLNAIEEQVKNYLEVAEDLDVEVEFLD